MGHPQFGRVGGWATRADNYEDRIRTYGNYCSNCPWQWSIFAFPNAAGLDGYIIQSGDKLYLRQWQTSGARGGPGLWFTDGSNTGNVTYDQDGELSNADTYSQVWHFRKIDLSGLAGKTVQAVGLITEGWTPPGSWEIYYQDIALVSSDGTVRPIYSRQPTVSFTVTGSSESTRGHDVNHITPAAQWADTTTTYYHGDHLGSSRLMTSENGYPVWSATYLPYGYEMDAQNSVNNYKFTDHERDSAAEGGLDHTLYRKLNSRLGRWMTPDPGGLAVVNLFNPQSWNRYSYVNNNPLNAVDPWGLVKCPDGTEASICVVAPPLPIDPQCAYWFNCFPRRAGGDGSSTPFEPDDEAEMSDATVEQLPHALAKVASVARCAAQNATSFQKLLGWNNFAADVFLSNDIAQLTQMVLGPGQMEAAFQSTIDNPSSVNIVDASVGVVSQIPTKTVITVSEPMPGGGWARYPKNLTVGEKVIGRTFAKVVGGATNIKLVFDAAAFAVAAYRCTN